MARRPKLKIWLLLACVCIALAFSGVLAWKTSRDLRDLPESLDVGDSEIRKPRVVDRNGHLLSITYLNRWNTIRTPIQQIPELIRRAFVESEDRRFHAHGGVDWIARVHALTQNIRAMRAVRGASTITEQVVRMLHPRPRTVWSRWIEGIEAARLEKRFTKSEILEFYLNQVPYAHLRRGIAEAAGFYFDRDLDTLNVREILGLTVLVRAPSHFDLKPLTPNSPARGGERLPKGLEKGITRLAGHLLNAGLLTDDQYRGALSSRFELARSERIIEASHFVQHVLKTAGSEFSGQGGKLTSTLDGGLQKTVRGILESRLEALRESEVANGAVLVVENATGEVLAWVSGSLSGADSGWWMDAVAMPRQPGSTLKPFLYALAMEMGWTPATLIDDSPMAQPVRSGIHSFQNYSRTYYGPLRLREALGNSLNTPAVRTIQFTGTARFLEWLHQLGFSGLKQSADFYGLGLALGDGEVSLFDLVQGYSVLARGGEFRPLKVVSDLPQLFDARAETVDWRPSAPMGRDGLFGEMAQYVSTQADYGSQPTSEVGAKPDQTPFHLFDAHPSERALTRKVLDENTASLIADILSDPQARKLEFGEGHLLRFPVQTAIKTGTSTDHRDCWAVGFSHRYTVGVWMGNFDRRPTRGITGAIGPALVLRSVFAELNRFSDSRPLPVSKRLATVAICASNGLLAGPQCPVVNELFAPGKAPVETCSRHRDSFITAGLNQEHAVDLPLIETPRGAERDRSPGSGGNRGMDATSELEVPPAEASGVEVAGAEGTGEKRPAAAAALEKISSQAVDRPEFYADFIEGDSISPGRSTQSGIVRLVQPNAGLEIAFDPRIPANLQVFAFNFPKHTGGKVEWIVDGKIAAETCVPKYLWPVSRGTHLVKARLWRPGASDPVETPEVNFVVK